MAKALPGSDVAGSLVKVTATTSGGAQLIHTHSQGVRHRGRFERVRLDATNTTGAKVLLTIQWVGTGSPDDEVVFDVPAQAGPVTVIPDWLLPRDGSVRAYAGSANAINLYVEARAED